MLRSMVLTGVAAMLPFGFALAQTFPPDATPTRIELPKDYATTFQRYDVLDKPDRKMVRFLYVNKDALAKVKPGEPFPEGIKLIMADHDIAFEAGGTPLRSKEGRLVPTGRVKAIAVMEKQKGWGETNLFPPEKDNGDWEYASFKADGALNMIKLDNCYACHLPQKGLDYTFSGEKIRAAAPK